MNFVSIKVIAEIDNIFIDGISDVTLIKMTEPDDGEEWTPKRIYNKIPFNQRGCLDKLLFAYMRKHSIDCRLFVPIQTLSQPNLRLDHVR
jgi:hypothetical protein